MTVLAVLAVVAVLKLNPLFRHPEKSPRKYPKKPQNIFKKVRKCAMNSLRTKNSVGLLGRGSRTSLFLKMRDFLGLKNR